MVLKLYESRSQRLTSEHFTQFLTDRCNTNYKVYVLLIINKRNFYDTSNNMILFHFPKKKNPKNYHKSKGCS